MFGGAVGILWNGLGKPEAGGCGAPGGCRLSFKLTVPAIFSAALRPIPLPGVGGSLDCAPVQCCVRWMVLRRRFARDDICFLLALVRSDSCCSAVWRHNCSWALRPHAGARTGLIRSVVDSSPTANLVRVRTVISSSWPKAWAALHACSALGRLATNVANRSKLKISHWGLRASNSPSA